MNITRVNQESLVIGISVSGKTEEVIEGLREAKKKELKQLCYLLLGYMNIVLIMMN